MDIIAEVGGRLVPFEVMHRSPEHTGLSDLKGMVSFCAENQVERGYVITREITDFQSIDVERDGSRARFVKIPAPLACYWLGRSEFESANRKEP